MAHQRYESGLHLIGFNGKGERSSKLPGDCGHNNRSDSDGQDTA
jgi:hypothetical protein